MSEYGADRIRNRVDREPLEPGGNDMAVLPPGRDSGDERTFFEAAVTGWKGHASMTGRQLAAFCSGRRTMQQTGISVSDPWHWVPPNGTAACRCRAMTAAGNQPVARLSKGGIGRQDSLCVGEKD